MKPTIAVVGSGVAGLAVAHELRERAARISPDVDVTCLEGSSRAGGNIRSEREDGFVCEWGPNGFLDDAPATIELVRRLGIERRMLPSSDASARRFVFRAGRLRRLPAGPVSFLVSDVLPLSARLRVLSEAFRRQPPADGESVFDFAARRIGEQAARVLVDAMVSGIHAGDARRLCVRSAFPTMVEMEARHGSLTRALLARRGARRGRLTSFLDGMQELTDHLALALGPSLRLDTLVTKVEEVGVRGFRVHLAHGAPIDAACVVLACPAWAAAEIVGELDDELARSLGEIPSAPVAVVHLGFDARELAAPLAGFGFLVPREQGPRILGALWTSSIFTLRAPEGAVLVTTMVGGAQDPEAVSLPEDRLLNLVRIDLRATMGVSAAPRFVKVIRHARAIPQYTLGHRDRLATIERRLAAHPGLFVCGNSYRGVSVNACIAEAHRVADAALASLQARHPGSAVAP